MISSFSDKNSSWNSFYNAGYTKLSNLPGSEHFFSNMIGLPAAMACIVGLLEVMVGIALIGLFNENSFNSIMISVDSKKRQTDSIGASIKRIEFKL